MNRVLEPPSPETRARLARMANEALPLDQWRARLAAPISPDEREEILALKRWFCHRYASPAERLSYARRTYLRWQKAVAFGSRPADGPERRMAL